MVFDSNSLAEEANGVHIPDDAPGGRYGYRLGHESGRYKIPDVVLNSPSRNIKVITIGAGISGIYLSYLIQKYGKNIEHVVYEKNGDIGGTWLENRYPGCACDVPSHAYTFAFALYPDWPKFLSPSEDIFRYLARVVECFGLRSYMTFNSTIKACQWEEAEGKWHVEIQDSVNGELRVDTCDVLVGANGILNAWRFPEEVEGLHSFAGRLIHTARWPQEYNEDIWKGQRIAVIGSGATSVQVVPSLQPYAKQLEVFVRTPVWFVELAGHGGDNFDYPPEERDRNRKDPEILVQKAKGIENKLNTAAGLKALMANSAEARKSRVHFSARMKKFIPDKEVFSKLLPNYAVGCRRLAPGNPYMRAVQQSNVRIHRSGVSKITPKGVIGPDDEEIEVDTIVCATGFDVSFRPGFSVIGRHGVSLQAKWKDIPEGYLSLAVPGIPNYFTVMGPSFPIANGSVMGPLQAVGNYILQMIQKMQREHIHSWAPKQDVTDAFNEHTQAWTRSSCWADPNCRSWYKNNETGRVNAIWPGSSLHFCELVRSPRYEDFEIKYQNRENMWEFLGLGFVKNQLESEGDLSPYINSDVVEHKFFSFAPNEEEEDSRVARRAEMVHDYPKV